MSDITFILGRTGTGKTNYIIDEIKKKCIIEPLGTPIFILTPQQMTFHMEYQLLQNNSTPSLIRTNVLTFNRLAHRIMQNDGGLSRYHLDDVGKAMLLKKIMLENKEEMGIYSNYIAKPGFITKLDELFTEFKNYQIDTGTFNEKVAQSNIQNLTKTKMNILTKLFDEFNETTLSKYLTTEDYFTHLIALIPQSELLKTTEIYIDGYHTFNAQEREIIAQLARHAKKLTIILTFDEKSGDTLWQTTKNTLDELKQQIAPIQPKTITMKNSATTSHEALSHLEKNFMQNRSISTFTDGINLFSTTNRVSEINEIAKKIHHLAHNEKVGYSNIAVYSANPQLDNLILSTVFSRHGIPYFLDFKQNMLTHPVINLLYNVFNVFSTNWSHNSLFTIFKSGIFMNTDSVTNNSDYYLLLNSHLEEIDQLENFVLSQNFKKHHWISGASWEYRRYQNSVQTDDDFTKQFKLNEIKTQVTTPLLLLEEKLTKSKNVIEIATAIFEFLEELKIPLKIELMMQHSNSLEKKQHEQVWGKINQILEQIVEVAHDKEMTLDSFASIFKTGLEQMNFATVPPTLDGVQIGDLNRSRYQLATNFYQPQKYGVEHAFIYGFNEGVIPTVPKESSLLSEKERMALAEIGIELAPSLEKSQLDEIFHLYTIMSGTKKSLTLSYTNESDAHPSFLFNQIKKMFPNVKERFIEELEFGTNLTTPLALFEDSILHFMQNPKSIKEYQSIIEYFKTNSILKHEFMSSALLYTNRTKTLAQNEIKSIYGEEIEASVARIELFNNCQFAHFMQYGLKLKERKLFQMEAPDIGVLYHESLKFVSMILKKQRRSFSSLKSTEITNLAEFAVTDSIKKYHIFTILDANSRMNILKNKLINIVTKTISAMAYQGEKSAFKETYFELKFSKNVNDKGEFGIKTKPKKIGDFELSLKGVIDRIDTVATPENNHYLRVIDYKSGKKDLDLDSVYYGLSLQLLTYLDVALTGFNEKYNLAGALYFHIHNPYHQVDTELFTDDHFLIQVQESQRKSYRMKGYLPENYEVAHLSDTTLNEFPKSTLVPISLKKDGSFASVSNKTLGNDDFKTLRTYTNQVIAKSTESMTNGQVEINPKKHHDKTACDFCKYKAICKFDVMYNKYENLTKMKPDVALEKIKKAIIQE